MNNFKPSDVINRAELFLFSVPQNYDNLKRYDFNYPEKIFQILFNIIFFFYSEKINLIHLKQGHIKKFIMEELTKKMINQSFLIKVKVQGHIILLTDI